jgi:hypothetical protein
MRIDFRNAAVATVVSSVGLCVEIAPASAHHSYSAFEMQKEITITGTVKRMDWTNPHIWLWVDVPNDKGGVDTWGIEGMSPNYLSRRGWTKSTLKPGDRVTVVISPLRDGTHGGSFRGATRPNGEKLTMTAPIAQP